ncbi:MAG: hypothetical protein HC880_11060 [Bacteroidia bacterium]|nr:hypothetical protein [Bacteroidia bacterium]
MNQKNQLEPLDESLWAGLKKADTAAFRQIYLRYWSGLFTYAFKILKDQATSEDIIQEIFTELWLKRENWKFVTWALTSRKW